MLAKIASCVVLGLDGVAVEVEVDLGTAQAHTTIVGLPDAAVQESRERVWMAIRNSGFSNPRYSTTVNLAPASVRKEGAVYDLPIALGILEANHQLPPSCLSQAMVIGELSLDGSLCHVAGVVAMAALARESDYRQVIVPAVDAPEAALIPDIEVIPAQSLRQLGDMLTGRGEIAPYAHTLLIEAR